MIFFSKDPDKAKDHIPRVLKSREHLTMIAADDMGRRVIGVTGKFLAQNDLVKPGDDVVFGNINFILRGGARVKITMSSFPKTEELQERINQFLAALGSIPKGEIDSKQTRYLMTGSPDSTAALDQFIDAAVIGPFMLQAQPEMN